MSEIPENIRKAVDEMLDAAIQNNEDVSTEQMMARAMASRDERAAKIAEETPFVALTNTSAPGDPIHHRYMFEVAASAQRSNIVNAIRTQGEN